MLVPLAITECILRLRREMDERLKKEEEERIARRKRVEAIMLRTRGKGSTPSSTPTKVLVFNIITLYNNIHCTFERLLHYCVSDSKQYGVCFIPKPKPYLEIFADPCAGIYHQ
jgi:hypothetical protein